VSVLGWLGYTEVVICLAALCFLVVKGQWRDYWAMGSFLAVRVVANTTLTLLSHFVEQRTMRTAYQVYFFVYWVAFAIESVLTLFIVYGVFRLTMQPLKGLQRVGTILFSVVAGISVVVAAGLAFGPHMNGLRYLMTAISQLERTQSILTLCMLLFVFLVMRPAGISGGSKIFGVSLGLGILAINDLVAAGWLAYNPHMATLYNLINGVVICAILVLWTAYFALPEPRRREVVADSLLSRWNKMCLARYGDPI
jgi:hypothetical protein